MTDYADLKVAPALRDVLETAAQEQYGQDFRAISRAGHEAVFAWLVLRADGDVVQRALNEHGFDTIDDLVDHLTDPAQDGRFSDDDQFDPLAALRTPKRMPDGDDIGGWPNGLYLVADTPPTAYALDVDDGTGDRRLLADALTERGIDHDVLGGDA